MSKTRRPLFEFVAKHRYIILVVLITAVAAFFRFYLLSKLPPGLHPDEAANGQDVFSIFKGDLRPLYATNGPREALFFYFQALFVKLMGNTILALRIAPALFGTLGVLTTYLWVKSWFGQRAGLIASFVMAVNPWSVTISRDGFRAAMTPLMVTLTLWLYTVAFRTKKRSWYALAGASLGLGLYTYLSFRLFIAALVCVAIYLFFFKKSFYKTYWKPVALSLIATTIVLLPLIIYGVKNPGDIGARAAGTSVLNASLNGGKPLNALIDSTVKTALMFNVHGDDNYRHNLSGEPALNVFVGIMFILGLLITLSHLNKTKYFALFACWGGMLAPTILSYEGIPHFLRAVGAIPFTMALAAIGIGYMLDRWYATFPVNSAARTTGLGIIMVLLLLTAYQGYTQYFVAWAYSPGTYEAYSEDSVAMANYMLEHKTSETWLLVLDGYSEKVVDYLTHDKASYRRLEPHQVAELPLDGKPKKFLVAKQYKDEVLATFKQKFPGGRLSIQYSHFNDVELFEAYEVTK